MVSDEQAQQIKGQILEHIDKNFPDDKKDIAKRKIATMDNSQLEEFLKQNQMIQQGQGQNQEQNQQEQNPFRAIVSGDIDAYKIGESNDAIAVLEINPISKAHTIIIPKEPITNNKKIPKKIFDFAEKIAKKIKTKLKPKNIKIKEANILGEKIINILPIYNQETFDSKRNKIDTQEAEKLQQELTKPVIKKQKTKKLNNKIWLPKRIP